MIILYSSIYSDKTIQISVIVLLKRVGILKPKHYISSNSKNQRNRKEPLKTKTKTGSSPGQTSRSRCAIFSHLLVGGGFLVVVDIVVWGVVVLGAAVGGVFTLRFGVLIGCFQSNYNKGGEYYANTNMSKEYMIRYIRG